MVYVDDSKIPFGRMLMSHMVADNVDELHAMADKIGLKRKWFQNKRIPHYDVCQSKKRLAIGHGAVQVTAVELVNITRGEK